MTTEISPRYSVMAARRQRPASITEMKARQSLKIREIENALAKAGHTTLDQQARGARFESGDYLDAS